MPTVDPKRWYFCRLCGEDVPPDSVRVQWGTPPYLVHSCGGGRVWKTERPFVDLFEDLF